MKSKTRLSYENLEFDLAFTGFMSKEINNYIDKETENLLNNVQTWIITLKSWVTYLRNNHEINCPTKILEKHSHFSMGLILTDDVYISRLNNIWRQKNQPTDVLSFPALDENSVIPLLQYVELGDIIISVETALKQSKSHNHSLADELRWLVSHGFLHLLGWDHPTQSSLDQMLSDQEHLIKESKANYLQEND